MLDVDGYAYPPRGLSREAAARYLGIDVARFDTLVKRQALPGPLDLAGHPVWDRLDMDRTFDKLNSRDEQSLSALTDRTRPFTPDDLAERWKVTASHVRKLISRGDLIASRVGSKLLRVSADAVRDYERGGPAPRD